MMPSYEWCPQCLEERCVCAENDAAEARLLAATHHSDKRMRMIDDAWWEALETVARKADRLCQLLEQADGKVYAIDCAVADELCEAIDAARAVKP